MRNRKVLVTLVANFLLVQVASEESSFRQNEPVVIIAESVQPAPVLRQPTLVTFDLSECVCSPISGCDLTILKSALTDVACKADEGLCCPLKLSPPPVQNATILEKPEELEVEAPRSNVRVYSISPMTFKDYSDSGKTELYKKPTKSCSCKSRNSCPPKYIDYGFGFYCSYSTVRCCIPEGIPDIPTEVVTYPGVDQEEDETVELSAFVTGPEPESERDSSEETSEESDLTLEEGTSESHDNADDNNQGLVADTDEENAMRALVEDEQNAHESVHVRDDIDVMSSGSNETSSTPNLDQPDEVYRHPYMGGEEEEAVEDEYHTEPVKEAAAESDLVITEVTDWTGLEDMVEDFETEPDCQCMPIHKCVMTSSYDTNNMLERRRDTVCPGGLIRCCGKGLEINKKSDDVAEYDAPTENQSGDVELPVESGDVAPYAPSSQSYLPVNESSYNKSPVVPSTVQTVPASSVLPVPYPGYQPPGFYKGYNYQPNTNTYNPNSQQVVNTQYYRNGQQQYAQGQYDTAGGQGYQPWVYSKYTPQYNGAQQNRSPYAESESSRHRSGGGILETLSKYLG